MRSTFVSTDSLPLKARAFNRATCKRNIQFTNRGPSGKWQRTGGDGRKLNRFRGQDMEQMSDCFWKRSGHRRLRCDGIAPGVWTENIGTGEETFGSGKWRRILFGRGHRLPCG